MILVLALWAWKVGTAHSISHFWLVVGWWGGAWPSLAASERLGPSWLGQREDQSVTGSAHWLPTDELWGLWGGKLLFRDIHG